MEALRKRFANDPSLYDPSFTNVNAPKQTAQPRSNISVITVSSTASESSNNAKLNKHRGNVVVLSDSEDEEVDSQQRQIPNAQADARPLNIISKNAVNTAKPVPIRVPNNKDLTYAKPDPRDDDYENFQLPNADDVVDRYMTTSDAEKALRDLVAGVYTHDDLEFDIEDATVPGFREGVTLLPHQVAGRRWMADRETGKKTGGILADDMGLGKTIQTITRIVEGRATKKDKKDGWAATTLVICPVAVVSQWASEIKKMAEGLKVIEHHGQNRTKDPEELQRAHVVITSYSIVASEHSAYVASVPGSKKKGKSKSKNDSSDDSEGSDEFGETLKVVKRKAAKTQKTALFGVRWWRIVLDEAHNIKNRTTKSAQACYSLESKYRWCLTGTPMQNNVEELFSLLHFLRVRPLNDWAVFKEQIATPVKAGRPARAMKRLQVVLRSIMLRRTKDTTVNGKPILELPPRLVDIVDCDFDPAERAFYDTVSTKVQNRLDDLKSAGAIKNSYTSMLVLLLRLRQACNHPSLVSQDYRKDTEAVDPKAAKTNEDDDDADDLADRLAGVGLSQTSRCQLCQTELSGPGDTCPECADIMSKARASESNRLPHSSKTRKVVQILQEIKERSNGQEKTIIFSQFTTMLDVIEPFLRDEGVKFVRYDGSMNKIQRDESLKKIKESRQTTVILISFKAGSTGLNLTCCNNVILVDLWWNPALEDQAFDRAHRFGQERAVNIHKLCVPDTVEQRILELQEKKRELARAALSGDKLKNMRLGVDDLVALFRGGHHDDDD